MSETVAAFGKRAPHKTIEHRGQTYKVSPVMTHGVMMQFEAKMYERAKAGLRDLRDAYTPEEYREELNALRRKHEEGYYAFQSEHSMSFLQTNHGAFMLLKCLIDADEDTVFDILMTKQEELGEFLQDLMEDSFPQDRSPKA